MSGAQNLGALMPQGSGSSFAQQGSLDWVALGNMQYSASIAVLGRLAKAGIDSLTVAFGQAMCTKLPIGSHGENILAGAMSTLAAKSCASDLLWFGTGVRHVLRELVQTSQGCSLVALCAALTEGHSIAVSALILYDIAKQVGGPQDLQPSLEQWQALIRTAAPAFNSTTFGLRVQQIARFAPSPAIVNRVGSDENAHRFHKVMTGTINTTPDIGHPTDLAKVLLSIGQIVQGNLHSVSLKGGCCCSWIAAWADFVLALRVLVRDVDGIIVFANFNPTEASAQVTINYVADIPNDKVVYLQTSHVVRSGVDFVRHCFGRHRLMQDHDIVFHSGSLTWDTMWTLSFGVSFNALIQDGDVQTTKDQTSIQKALDEKSGDVFLPPRLVFSRVIAIAILVLFAKSPVVQKYSSVELYLSRLCTGMAELRCHKEQIQADLNEFLRILGPADSLLDLDEAGNESALDILIDQYFKYRRNQGNMCSCKDHLQPQLTASVAPAQFCLIYLTETVVYMMYLLDRVVLDVPLQPTIYGMHRIYSASAIRPESEGLFQDLTRSIDQHVSSVYGDIASLFAGQDWGVDLLGCLAKSDGKLYCYSRLVEGLTDNIQVASQIHVGSGQMEYRSRIHQALLDNDGRGQHEAGYPARSTQVVDSTAFLGRDTTSSPISSEVVIVETPAHLYLRHRVNTASGYIEIIPTLFLQRLQEAMEYQHCTRISLSNSTRWNAVLQGHQYIVVEGEGLVEVSHQCHVLRPLQGNILGSCAAIAKTQCAVALVRDQKDLELFARFWCMQHDKRKNINMGLIYYVLIS